MFTYTNKTVTDDNQGIYLKLDTKCQRQVIDVLFTDSFESYLVLVMAIKYTTAHYTCWFKSNSAKL